MLVENYGVLWPSDMTKRKEAWALLRHLSNFQPSPSIVVGDFNEIVDLTEK